MGYRDLHDLARFSVGFAIALLLIVLVGFGSFMAKYPEIAGQTVWLHHVHALIMLAWFALLIGQPLLIAASHETVHRTIGRFSPLLAAGVLIGGISMIRQSYLVRSDVFTPAVDIFILLNFAIFYGVALLAIRRSPPSIGAHQRLMLLSGAALTPPAIARLAEVLGIGIAGAIPVVLAVAFAPAGRDLAQTRRVHPASLLGGLAIMAGIVAGLAMANTKWWALVLERLWGPA
ncbi:hypothetical protein [Qipengyuania qiaonensis]|uniref:Uncharacterized protein n=1 Tax=Qipengyuania qiaonensis TaxID=2867240 RepID=A0ABS7JCK5_9SPHN|nr:hypothetical protein [Qipengyuania qiaonensis]MBX7483690.1 hypothetical protein [Qipengyuania qiaonensis]